MVGTLILRHFIFACCILMFGCESTSKTEELIQLVVDEKAGIEVEFKSLHDSLFTQLPDSTPSRILAVLIRQGFEVTQSGSGNFDNGPRIVVKTLQQEDCECTLTLKYHNTRIPGAFELRESLMCE